jgi:plastocyanin
MRPLLVALLALALLPASAAGQEFSPQPSPDTPEVTRVSYDGMQTLRYRYGPITITPGQNTIEFRPNMLKPQVPGYITRFRPDLVRVRDGEVPRVDELHLHHGVWIMRGYPTFAAGEEKTITQFPRGFGYRYDPSDPWIMNYMIHNLLPNRDRVYLTYEIDFVPADSAAGRAMTEVRPLWMDVAGISAYPVFDVRQGEGRSGRYTFPNHARGADRRRIGFMQSYRAPQDMTLVGTAGHLHPGGLYTDLDVTRNGDTRRLFRSEAKYWEPAGAVSWDVAMTATDPDWRVNVRQGDRLHVSATYDSARASWYESMGIMVTYYAEGLLGTDPYAQPVDTLGTVTHGQLPENRNHGGGPTGLPNPRRMLATPRGSGPVGISDFVYRPGDLTGNRIPSVRRGRSLTFRNRERDRDVWHTITACRAPCNRETGIAYPLADGGSGARGFDSGQLGLDRRAATAAAQRMSWSTPRNLRPGTYTYFCRVHPFMRGAFRVRGR